MIKNYLKTAWRNLKSNKLYSFINIAGLATGMGVALLIGLWIWDEVSFNSHFKNHKDLAQVMIYQSLGDESGTDESAAVPVGKALEDSYSDIVKSVSFVSSSGDHLLTIGDKKITGNGMWTQKKFTTMFTLQMIEGSASALEDPSSILISESMAKAAFGNAPALNNMVRIDNKIDLKVSGVYADLPHNTVFYNTKMLLPWDNAANSINKQTEWENHCTRLFVQLNEGVDAAHATAKVKNIPTPHITRWKEELVLHPLDRSHLYSQFEKGIATGGRIVFVWLFGIIGVSVLLLACINFMNLSTARSEKRAKEVGIRKTMGSLRGQLIRLFLGESILTAVIALVLAFGLVLLAMPFFNSLSDKSITIPWSNAIFWMMALGFTIFTGLIAGSYPAFYLSRFKPVKVLKGSFKAGRFAAVPRKVLVVVQFTVSIALIIGTVIVYRQIEFAKDRPVGYSREGLINVPLTPELFGRYELLRDHLIKTGAVENMAESSQVPTYFNNNNSIEWRGKDPNLVIFFRDVNVTHDFGKTIGWTIKEGRDFSKEFATDTAAVILNETAVKAIGIKQPVGEVITYHGKSYRVVGVVKDMLTQSPYMDMEPSVFFCGSWMGSITIRLKRNYSVQDALTAVGNVFKQLAPSAPFQYKFIDEEYARKFSDEQRIGNLAALFTILAVFISCLGLFGLASFTAEQRKREIGVRKVLGASVFSIWSLLSKDFVKLVTISIIIAIPLALYYMNTWLQSYPYRVSLSLWVFVAAGSAALLITLITVSFQAIKAAIANPVKSLRTE